MVNELKEKVRKLEKELSTANNHIQFLSDVTGTGVPGEEKKTSGDGTCEFCGKLNKSGFASNGADSFLGGEGGNDPAQKRKKPTVKPMNEEQIASANAA